MWQKNTGERKRNSINNSIYFDYNIFCHDNYDNEPQEEQNTQYRQHKDKIIINLYYFQGKDTYYIFFIDHRLRVGYIFSLN